MNTKYLDLKYLINLDSFQQLQDDIAELMGFGFITVDYKGIPITTHSRNCDFCKIIRNNPELGKLCQKSDSRGGLESARLRKPYIYLCHMGLVDFAVPIIVEDNYLGAILGGQIMIEGAEDCRNLERIFYNREYMSLLERDEELKKLHDNVPRLSLSRVETVAKMIMHFSKYIADEAVFKASLQTAAGITESSISWDRYNNDFLQAGKQIAGVEPADIKWVDARSISDYKETFHGNAILKPAIDYLNDNPREKIYIEKAASLCNISVSYFSRLFKKELKITFSRYVNMLKIREAKELLELTRLQIGEIAYTVGYEDPGYFIKVFKEYENETPAAYRKQYFYKVKKMNI